MTIALLSSVYSCPVQVTELAKRAVINGNDGMAQLKF